jgi:hypothetical protein
MILLSISPTLMLLHNMLFFFIVLLPQLFLRRSHGLSTHETHETHDSKKILSPYLFFSFFMFRHP